MAAAKRLLGALAWIGFGPIATGSTRTRAVAWTPASHGKELGNIPVVERGQVAGLCHPPGLRVCLVGADIALGPGSSGHGWTASGASDG